MLQIDYWDDCIERIEPLIETGVLGVVDGVIEVTPTGNLAIDYYLTSIEGTIAPVANPANSTYFE